MIALLTLSLLSAPSPKVYPDGLELLTIARPGPRWTELKVAVRMGTRDDPEGREGMAQVLALMLGAQLGPRVKITVGQSALLLEDGARPERIGARISAIKKALQQLESPQKMLEAAISSAGQSQQLLLQNDRALSKRAMEKALHLSSRDPAPGDIASLVAITAQDVQAHVKKHVVRGALIIGLAGTLPDIKAQLARWPPQKRPASKASKALSEAPESALRLIIVDKPSRGATNAEILIAKRLESGIASPAMKAASAALGGGLSSSLTRTLNTSGLKGRPAVSKLEGALHTVRMSVPRARAGQAIAKVLEALARLEKDGLSPSERALGRSIVAAQDSLASKDANSALYQALLLRLSAASPPSAPSDEAINAAAKTLGAKGRVVVVVTNATAALKAALVQLGKVSLLSYDRL